MHYTTLAKNSPLSTALEIAPLLESQSSAHDRIGKLTDETVDALKSGNLFGLMVPRELGGFEASPVETLEVFEEVSRADGATGWVLTTCGFAGGLAGAFLDRNGADSLFGKGMPVVSGAGAPNGRADIVEGGYRLSGRWGYGSGIKHATHLHTGGIVYEGDKPRLTPRGTPEALIFSPPIEVVTLHDNWDVLGVRGSGSVDYEIKDAFLPFGHAFSTTYGKPQRGGAPYRVGTSGMSSIAHAGFALGVGRRALDELGHIVRGREGRRSELSKSESFLENYGKTEAEYRAARALVYATWRDIQDKCERGGQADTRDTTLGHIALNHIMWTSAKVADFAYASSGGTGLRDGSVQRCFRDIHAGTQHMRVAPVYLREGAKELLGLVPDPVWERAQVLPALPESGKKA